MHAHTEYIDTHPFFCLKKYKTKTTQPPQLRLKGNCSGDKLFWMVKVLPVKTQSPASARTPLAVETPWTLDSQATGNLALPCPRSSADGPAGRQPSHGAEAAVPRPAISFSFSRVLLAGPWCPCPAPLAALLGPQEAGVPLQGWGRCTGWGGGERPVSALGLGTRWADGFERWAEGCKIRWV